VYNRKSNGARSARNERRRMRGTKKKYIRVCIIIIKYMHNRKSNGARSRRNARRRMRASRARLTRLRKSLRRCVCERERVRESEAQKVAAHDR